jgi:transcriptional regulator with XRE-family HTH domain
MITVSQIRAARALLNWTQGYLAKKCGLSLRALNSIERGLVQPRLDNLRAIQETLEKADIEFQEFDGVRRRTERLEIFKFEGPHCMEQHLIDTVQSMQGQGEVLMSLGSEKKFTGLRAKSLDDYFAHLARHGITERGLIADGDTHVIGRPSVYRWMAPEAFSQMAYIVYGDTVVFLIPKKPQRTILIRSPSMAEMFRRQFEFNWKMAETPWFAKRFRAPDLSEPWSSTKAAGARAWITNSARYAEMTKGR